MTAPFILSMLLAGGSVTVHDFTARTIDGKEVALSQYRGKVLLIVNTASECGYTGQYKGLEALYQEFKGKGLEILAFPSNDFGGQEPGTNAEIKKFCELRYRTTFPLFSLGRGADLRRAPEAHRAAPAQAVMAGRPPR